MARTPEALARDRMLATDRQRRLRERAPARRVVNIDELAVTCWCEAEIVRVPRQVVLDGSTGSCGRPNCTDNQAA